MTKQQILNKLQSIYDDIYNFNIGLRTDKIKEAWSYDVEKKLEKLMNAIEKEEIKSYTGLTKEGKPYEPTLFSEIYEFYMVAPQYLQREMDSLLEGEKFEEAVELIEEFFDIAIPEKTRKQLTYAEKGFLPRELPYGMTPKKAKKSKYWKYSKSPKIKHMGT